MATDTRGTDLQGSRAAQNVVDPTKHASDWEDGAPTIHNPLPGAIGGITVSDGAKWIATVNPILTGTLTVPNEGLHLFDTGGDHDLILKPGSDLDADYIFTITTGNGARTLNLGGNFTIDATASITGGGTLDLATFTLTVPATGTAALLGTANVFTETNTFPGVKHAPQAAPSGDTGHVAYDSTKERLVLQHEHHDFQIGRAHV